MTVSELPIYAISGYVPEDENVINISVYKLCKIGKVKPIYIWIAINYNGGIGVSIDEHDTSIEDAMITIYRYVEDSFNILKCKFEQLTEEIEKIKQSLQHKLQ